MLKINKEKVIKELNLTSFGQKGWLSNRETKCPGCGRSGKFGINLTKPPGVAHCFICEYSKSICEYLKSIGKKELYSFEKTISLEDKIPYIETRKKDEEEIPVLQEIPLPHGFKFVEDNDYLRGRGYTDEQFKKYPVGKTTHFLEKKLHDYIIFPIYQRGVVVAWLARSIHNYEWHEKNLRRHKEGLEYLKLRYINSNQDFSKIVGGLDELSEKTKVIIIVEGYLDKLNIDRLLKLYDQDEIKCCCTFGNTVKKDQISLIGEFSPNLDTIILMYDAETIKQTKQYGLILSKKYNVKVAELNDPDIDPGNITLEKLEDLLCNLKDIYYFCTNRITKKLNL